VDYQKEMEYNNRFNKYFMKTHNKDCGCTDFKIPDFHEVYLDYNATTPIRPEVSQLIEEYTSGKYGFANASSNTVQGYYTHELISNARREIASCLSSDMNEIYYTSSGSEANNLAIKGIAFKYLEKKGHLITSKIEHPSVLLVMKYLETIGFTVSYLDVDKDGLVAPESVSKAITHNTILVSIMAANNEIGTINPIKEIGEICKKRKVLFMVDAIQAFGKIPINPKEMGISLLSISGHKIYAPKGIGALFIEKGVSLVPQIHGGGQESGLRAGTENVGSIMAFGKAVKLIHEDMEKEGFRLNELKNYFLNGLKQIDNSIIINGSINNRLPNNLSIGFENIDSGALVRSLNRIGISASASSACCSRKNKISHVLNAIGVDTEKYGIIRFSLGLNTIKEDLNYVLKYLDKILEVLRNK
ncbi:cysteine desulfurase, partial [Candidatus Pacearchaeota archaeon]|nr:cysteine desulfurase [Candidatus Pacearchaeota archaeon]